MLDSRKPFVINFVIGNFLKTLRKKFNPLEIQALFASRAAKLC